MYVMLVHPQHGTKFATSQTEIEHDENFGWTIYTEPTPAAEPAEAAPRPKRRRVIDQPVEQPNSETLASDESEGT